MLIEMAHAADTAAQGNPFISFLPFVLIIGVFYFLIIRPQQKRAKDHRAKIDSIRRGDRVVTNGGILGTVSQVNESNEVELEIAPGVNVKIVRHMIADILAKPEPVNSNKANKTVKTVKKTK